MIELSKCNRLLDEGFSLLTVGDSKVPNFSWKPLQNTPITKEELNKRYNYKGGIKRKDNTELPATTNIGIITGYNYLVCIDVDLKVFSTAKEQLEFWNEYLSYLEDTILDFKKKVVIKKTKNNGFHILFKSKRVKNNKKLASLKGHTEAVIETRETGGYIFYYEESINDKDYKDIDFITDKDRDSIYQISESYNHIEEVVKMPKKNTVYNEQNNGLTSWEDFNNQNTVLDVVSDDFTIVRTLSSKYVIKRIGAQSASSGYVFKDNGCMFLHSTGTIYPSEQQITAAVAYTYKYHNGNFSEAAKDLYNQGFGERIKPKKLEVKETFKLEKIDSLDFPLEVFPEDIKKYILACNKTLNSSIDYMGCSFLFLLSVMVGNSFCVEVKSGWREFANLWIVLVGKAGIGKTPSINNMTFPLMKQNTKEIKKYIKQMEKYEFYSNLSKKEKEMHEEVFAPSKTQFIANDVTLEALVELHGENPMGVGVLRDELAGWFKDMNKYNQGSDIEHWLSSWSGKEINMNRRSVKSSFVDRAFIPVLGGIQPDIMDTMYTSENKDNGFIDRMLFSFPKLKVEPYNMDEMDDKYIKWYEEFILSFYATIKKTVIYDKEGLIIPRTSKLTNDSRDLWVNIFNEITGSQNSDTENEYMKSMLPKQKSYIPRFALLLQVLNSFSDKKQETTTDFISVESMQGAKKLSDYFISMSKKIKVNSIETKEILKEIKKNSDKDLFDQFKSIYLKNKDVSKTKLSDKLGVSRQTIYRYVKKLEK